MATFVPQPPSPTTTISSRPVSGYQEGEPNRASSVLPVLGAFGALFAIAFGAAYFGRDLITVIGTLLGT